MKKETPMYSVTRIREITETVITEVVAEFNRLIPDFCKDNGKALRVKELLAELKIYLELSIYNMLN